ncbi:tRNA (N6-threonylcarbamoyladenosine(37)-N6)-methyltransferase TrmO, partial [uncultured Akkermansia sp.]|uniref:tRNA (N6-threonylcarbamoyladenosine(37)-N6)-methyltransferase TrmO n=1 Tax=uncultured Akkermansia sp. TaxID=512294 RepID=UPI0026193B1B
MQPVARVSTCYPDKFGVPRQSGLVPGARARLVFEPPFRHPDAVRGLEGFSHLWLVWVFSENVNKGWSPTVRPPRLGGNVRMGVFATRAPFRPNPIGLSAVRLEKVELHPLDGPVLHLSGVDLVDGTPILDIKPYVPLADCIPGAIPA